MKRLDIQLSAEEKQNYDFDTEYVVAESAAEVGDLYARGYLPAFLPPASKERFFYLAPRSLRVDLEQFDLSSENRRVLKKTQRFGYEIYNTVGAIHESSYEQFEYDPIRVGKFCKDYFDKKFGKGLMSVSRIKRIFAAPMTTHVFEYSVVSNGDSPERVGYVTTYLDADIFNYTFAFYDLDFYKENLGIRMMLDSVVSAKHHGQKYIYLGSVKDESGLYKTQFKGWEFWSGDEWSSDKDQLKEEVGSGK